VPVFLSLYLKVLQVKHHFAEESNAKMKELTEEEFGGAPSQTQMDSGPRKRRYKN
jgi:hypothetical protein